MAAEIQTALSGKVGDAVEIADCGAEGLAEYDGFIVGAPTWHTDRCEHGDRWCGTFAASRHARHARRARSGNI